VLLHPLMAVIVLTPEECIGEVIGDLNSRQGEVRSMDNFGIQRIVTALVPLANLFGYPHSLRNNTGRYIECLMAFSHYERVPPGSGGGDDFSAPAALR
jgi:elongation factor G